MGKERLARLEAAHPENRGVLAHLVRRRPEAAPIARPSAVPDPYMGAGSHPDVVERLWDGLGSDLPRAARALVHGAPALVHPGTGLVVAVALGTQYVLRLPRERLAEAGLATRHTYRTTGDVLDLADFGGAWRIGAFDARERGWLAELFHELDRA